MPDQAEIIRRHLTAQAANAAQLAEKTGISQPTLSRALQAIGSEILRFGAGKSIHYALRDTMRGPADIPVYRADIPAAQWRQALELASEWFVRVQKELRFSPRFAPCIAALRNHLDNAATQVAQLAT